MNYMHHFNPAIKINRLTRDSRFYKLWVKMVHGIHILPEVECGNRRILATAVLSLHSLNYHLQPRGVYEFHAPFKPTIYKNANLSSAYLFLIGGLKGCM